MFQLKQSLTELLTWLEVYLLSWQVPFLSIKDLYQ